MIWHLFSKLSPAKPFTKNVVGLDVDEKSVKLLEIRKTPQGYAIVNFAVK